MIAEFYDVTTRPKAGASPIFTRKEARLSIEGMRTLFSCLVITSNVSKLAVQAARERQMRIYDAQIWAVAKEWQLPLILSEDLLGGDAYLDGVRIVNPFDAAFDLTAIGL